MLCKFAKYITLLICLLALSQETLILRLAFICPEGGTLKQKPSYFPISNGCGGSEAQVLLGSVLNPFTPFLVGCCNVHDICFGTCNLTGESSFSNCNDQFRNCLQN